MKNDKREFARRKCKKPANLICEGDPCGDEKYLSVQVVDESETGFKITSRNKVDVSDLLTISFYTDEKQETFPAEFIWMHKGGKTYMIGLKIMEE